MSNSFPLPNKRGQGRSHQVGQGSWQGVGPTKFSEFFLTCCKEDPDKTRKENSRKTTRPRGGVVFRAPPPRENGLTTPLNVDRRAHLGEWLDVRATTYCRAETTSSLRRCAPVSCSGDDEKHHRAQSDAPHRRRHRRRMQRVAPRQASTNRRQLSTCRNHHARRRSCAAD